MADEHNVGAADRFIRFILGGVCVGLLVYHFAVDSILPIYALLAVLVLIPFFLKTAATRVCPIMKAMNVSTLKKDN